MTATISSQDTAHAPSRPISERSRRYGLGRYYCVSPRYQFRVDHPAA
jgi:hypothetical protein